MTFVKVLASTMVRDMLLTRRVFLRHSLHCCRVIALLLVLSAHIQYVMSCKSSLPKVRSAGCLAIGKICVGSG